jgi:hypothetical protein
MLSNFMNKPGGRVNKNQQDEVLQLIRDNDRSITVVDCGKDLEEEFTAELCRALQKNRYVTTLRIREREMSQSVDALAALCAKTTTLVQMKISYAELTDEDTQVICGSLLNNKSIQNLSLDHNRITTPEAIVMLLSHNKTLDSLDLSYNNLGAQGDRVMFAIAEALGRNTTLKQLYLSGNGISDLAARKLVEVLDQNLHTSRLRVLDIAGENSVRAETKQALKLVLEAGRQVAATAGNRTDDGDDLRSQLTGLGYTGAAAVLSGAPHAIDAVSRGPSNGEGLKESDVEAWQAQVDATASQFDDERRELQSVIDKLKQEREQSIGAQIAALEQTNRLQQQVALLTEKNTSLQRELDMVTTKYDRKVKESGEQVQTIQGQLTFARKELVRQQEMAAADRARLVELQESMTQELTSLHEQLAAATRANDLLDHAQPTALKRGAAKDASVVTELHGMQARQALHNAPKSHATPPAAAGGQRTPRRSNDEWSESTGDTSVRQPASSQPAQPAGHSYAATTAPPTLPRNQWMDDDSAPDCKSCRKPFNITRRKHHCRVCGQLYCNNCCPTNKQWDLRVCPYCLDTHTR